MAACVLRNPSESSIATKRTPQSEEYASLARLISTIRGLCDKYGMATATTPQMAEQNELNIMLALAAIARQHDNRYLDPEVRYDNIGDLVTAFNRIDELKRKVGDLSRINYQLQRFQVEEVTRLSTHFHSEKNARAIAKMTAFQKNCFENIDRAQSTWDLKLSALHGRLQHLDDRIKRLKHK